MCQALNSNPRAGQRVKNPQPLPWPWIGSVAWRRSRATPVVPTQLRLTITQVPPFLHDEIVPSEHLVDLPRDVEGEHRLPAAAFCMTADHRHHGPDTVCERALGRVGHELVVRLPCKGRLGPVRPERAAGDEVALKVEGVVNRGMDREKALG